MHILELSQQLPNYAKDIKLNVASLFNENWLTTQQKLLIIVAVAKYLKNPQLTAAVQQDISEALSEQQQQAAYAATTIMAMNNIYYRFTHLCNEASVANLSAKLRMNIMSNPGIDQVDFELCSLAISALNGCGMCMEAHTKALLKAQSKPEAIQQAVRIAAVFNAFATALN